MKNAPVVIHATLPSDGPRPRLVPRVWAERASTAYAVLKFRMIKALKRDDRDGFIAVAKSMTQDQRHQALEEIAEESDRLEKSETVAKGYWSGHDYSLVHPRPPQERAQAPAKPKGAEIVALGEGAVRRSYRPTVGAIVNFKEPDGTIRHGKIRRWGSTGASIVSNDGEFKVAWSALSEGVHPSSEAEYQGLAVKAAEREKRRWWHLAESLGPWVLTPEQRADYYKTKANPD